MRIVVCDRCGRKIQNGEMIGSVAVNMRREYQGPMVKANPYSECDFCEDCMREIVTLIDTNPYADPEEEEPEEEDETEQKPDPAEEEEAEEEAEEDAEEEPVGRLADTPKPSHGVNLRELRELVKAGKKPKEIAEHFGITVASFYNYRKRAEALWNAGRL